MEFRLRFLMLFALVVTVIVGAYPDHDHAADPEYGVACEHCDTNLHQASQTDHASCPDMIACSIAALPVETATLSANTTNATRLVAPLSLLFHGVLPDLDLPPPRT